MKTFLDGARQENGVMAIEGENRAVPRRPVHWEAQIVYHHGNSIMPCTINDVSEYGARIRLAWPAELPDSFWLYFTGGKKEPVEVIWRKAVTLGVRFLERERKRPVMIGAGTKTTLISRLMEVEKQLAELRLDLMTHLQE